MDYVDYYAELGVARDAPAADVTQAFKKLARRYHPDVNKEPGAEERFKRIVEAHDVLKDPESRAKYDRFGSAWNRVGPAPPEAGGARRGRGRPSGFEEANARGFSEIFEAMFGRGRPGGFTGAAEEGFGVGGQPIAQGEDLDVRVQLGLAEALTGGDREIRLQEPGGRERALRVTIPKGVRDGQKVRLRGQGHKGVGGAPAGDLFLHIELLAHPDFELDGDDLRTAVKVAPWTAVLGGEAKVETLDGALMVKVPAGSSTGRRIRLRGKGWPNKDGRGDLYAEVQVMVPKTITDKERVLWEKLQAVSDFMSQD